MTPSFKTMLIGFLIAAALIFAVIVTGHAADREAPVASSIPSDPAVSVVAIIQCNHMVGMIATMPNGAVLAFDKSSPLKFEDTVAWANTAKHLVVVEVPCRIEPGQLGI